MPFSTRVFCTELRGPSLSDLLAWLMRHDAPVVVAGGASKNDLLSLSWREVRLCYDPGEPPFTVRCHRDDAESAASLRAEVDDFLADIEELPESPPREQVVSHLRATRSVVVVEFPPEGVTPRGYATNGWLMAMFVEESGGMVQCDGIGFYQENELILPLA